MGSKIHVVTDGQTDSLTNLIKCMVVYSFYSCTFWSTSLWSPGVIKQCVNFKIKRCGSSLFGGNTGLYMYMYVYLVYMYMYMYDLEYC